MSQIYDAIGLSLTIILHAHTLVDPDMLSETYSNTDIEYMRTFKLEGEAYDADNNFFGICLNRWSLIGQGRLILSRLAPRKMVGELIKLLPDMQKVVRH